MRRTSRARMRSLIRCCSRCGGAAMAVHPCAMADLLLLFGCSTREPAEQIWVWTQQCRWTRTHHRWPGGGCPRFSRDDPVRVTDVADESTRRGRAGDPPRRGPGGDRGVAPAPRRGAGGGRGHQPRDGALRAGRDPPVGEPAQPARGRARHRRRSPAWSTGWATDSARTRPPCATPSATSGWRSCR